MHLDSKEEREFTKKHQRYNEWSKNWMRNKATRLNRPDKSESNEWYDLQVE